MTQLLLPRQKLSREFALDPSLMLYLPLYELDGASFMSKDHCGHICTVTSAPPWTPQGRTFDGLDDKVSVAHNTVLNPATEVSLLVWFKPLLYSIVTQYVVGKGHLWSAGYRIHQTDVGGVIYVWPGVKPVGQAMQQYSMAITLDMWSFLALTYHTTNGGGVYKNGELVSPITGLGDIDWTVNPTTALTIACRITADFNICQIGEVWVYNRALTVGEIQHNYLATRWRYQ